jgi:hypothetical protein
MTKKEYYKKKHADCPCCGWQGHVRFNARKWLGKKRGAYHENNSNI